MDFLPEVIGGDEEVEAKHTQDAPHTHEPPQMDQEDIFDEPLVMKTIKEEPPVKKKRKGRVMTDEQKEKLAQARVKALETRRRNTAEKNEIKELEALQKKQKLDQLRSSVGRSVKKVSFSPPPPEPDPQVPLPEPVAVKPTAVVKSPPPQRGLTQLQIDEISMKAVMEYDKVRKSRKKEKEAQRKKDKEAEDHRVEMMRLCSRADPKIQTGNYWDNCF